MSPTEQFCHTSKTQQPGKGLPVLHHGGPLGPVPPHVPVPMLGTSLALLPVWGTSSFGAFCPRVGTKAAGGEERMGHRCCLGQDK